MKTENEITAYLAQHLGDLIPGAEVIECFSEYKIKNHKVDLLAEVRIGNNRRKLVCEVKSVGEPRYLLQAISLLKLVSSQIENSYPVIIAPSISERGQELCKENDVGFIDFLGNAFLRFEGVFIERFGKEKRQTIKPQIKKLFSPVSTRILRALLEESQKTWKLLELANESKASLGYVHKVTQNLQGQEFLKKAKAGLILKDPGKLLDAWSKEYDFSINKINSYYSFIKDPSKMMLKIEEASKRMNLEYAMTLHAGASLVAPFVRFTDVHFYFEGGLKKWVEAIDLRPVEFGGTVHLVEPYDEGVFYSKQNLKNIKVVSNVQLYLDLYNYPARGREQAEFLRKEKLRF